LCGWVSNSEPYVQYWSFYVLHILCSLCDYSWFSCLSFSLFSRMYLPTIHLFHKLHSFHIFLMLQTKVLDNSFDCNFCHFQAWKASSFSSQVSREVCPRGNPGTIWRTIITVPFLASVLWKCVSQILTCKFRFFSNIDRSRFRVTHHTVHSVYIISLIFFRYLIL